ncbi:MAG: 3D domain-containing protein [Akkermansia sp.]
MNITSTLTRYASILLAIVCIGASPSANAVPNKYATSSDFKLPAAPSPSARPSAKLPNLGRDKHGMPFYHPKQLNRVVRTTAYTHTESDHVGYGPKNAISTYLVYNDDVRSAAADWSVYPLGTKFKIKGQPYTYIVDDYGSALVGTGTIDIYQPTKGLMRKWGRRIVEISVIEWGSSQQSMKQLAARTRFKHCKEMQTALKTQEKHSQTAQH